MKRNGFTFIEILGVITLLALLSIIVLTVVDKNLKDSKDTLSEVQIENIKSAASMWRTDNIELVPEDGYYVLFLGDLINNGYIDDVIDPNSNNEYDRGLALGIGMNDIRIDSQENLLTINGYTKLDYIKSTGSQYIDLGYAAKKNTEIRLDVQFVENDNTNLENQPSSIIGRDKITDTNVFTMNFGAESGQKRQILYWIDKGYGYGGTIKSKNYGASVTSRSIMTVKSGLATFQGITIEIAKKTQDNTENMILLGGYNSTAQSILAFNRYDAKVYSFQVYEGDKLIMDMAPYMKNEKAGLYDFVSNKFYLSDGSSDFLYGELE